MPEVNVSAIRKSRPPARVVRGDDFPFLRDGATYYPHAGEEVRFRGAPSNGFVQDLMHLAYLLAQAVDAGGALLTIEDGGELDLLFERVRAEVAAHIESWTWTDPVGRPLPENPSADDVRAIPLAELMGLSYALVGE